MKKPIYALSFLILTIFFAEAGLRAFSFLSQGKAAGAVEGLYRRVSARIYAEWLNQKKRDPFMPPYRVFTDENATDENRLRQIWQQMQMMPGEWTSYDFLREQSDQPKTIYHININKLGFRGPERSPEKAKNVLRIVTLGDYHAFGHGVDDSQTYSAQVELALAQALPNRKVEVWNGGKHAATAIMGLARLKNQIATLAPDVIVFDYGFVDPNVWRDDLLASSMSFPQTGVYPAATLLWRWLKPLMDHSLLFFRVQEYLFKDGFKRNRENFENVLHETVSCAKRMGVPLILIRQPQALFEKGVFSQFESKEVKILDAVEIFARTPPAPEDYASPSENWVKELPLEALYEPNFVFWPYQTDAFQLSARGHYVLAQALNKTILEILK